jgi:hypothetical protein
LRIFVGLLAVALTGGFFVANHFRRSQEASLREEATMRVQQPLQFKPSPSDASR